MSNEVANIDEVMARLAALQKENEALKASAGTNINGVMVSVGEYKGQPVIQLSSKGSPPLSFGRAKAKLIVAAFEEIKKFANS